MKFYITGSSRGLGKLLCKEFNCVSFDKPYDLSVDIEQIVEQIEPNSVVILNAYANGSQIEYLKRLRDKCKIIVCGSIAGTNQDVTTNDTIKYSMDKLLLEKIVTQIALKSKLPILYLRLTASSYKDHQLIINTIKFWLDNPSLTFAGYNINE
jgi:hypothetical protein